MPDTRHFVCQQQIAEERAGVSYNNAGTVSAENDLRQRRAA